MYHWCVRYAVDETSGCWIWKGQISVQGYGVMNKTPAHRAVYELLVGRIPGDCEIHHICGNRACVNPEHLEPKRVRDHRQLHHPQKDECIWGHRFDDANTYVRANGDRQCRKCKARRERERQRRLREAAGFTQPPARTSSPDL